MQERKDHFHSKVTARGQITLPAGLRMRLGIKHGDVVEVREVKSDEGLVIKVRRQPSLIEATAGIARPKIPHQTPDWDEVEQIVKEEVGKPWGE